MKYLKQISWQMELPIHILIFGNIKPIFFFILLAFLSCKENEISDVEQKIIADKKGNLPVQLTIPKGFPTPTIPSDNILTQNKIDLGKKLFFDPILSRDSTISCSSCHNSNLFFTDNAIVSTGIEGRLGKRNTQSLINIAYQTELLWDGAALSLEQQVVVPIKHHDEMDFDTNKVVERLKKHPIYVTLFQKTFLQEPSVSSLKKAIASFERTLLGGTSRFDRFLAKDSSALTASEIRGHTLFFNESGDCFHCHDGFNFTDNSFRNNGLYFIYADSGRAKISLKEQDIGKFRVPSLRNIAKTAPYMHDGSLATLDAVLDHYITGGKRHYNRSPVIRPLILQKSQKQDLIDFLGSLTDE